MTDHVKHLPAAALPERPLRRWAVEDARHWLDARVPGVFAPVAGSWVLALLVVTSQQLTGWQGWKDSTSISTGTTWAGYPQTVLLLCLPLWFRHLPGATLPAAVAVGAESAASLFRLAPDDRAGRAAHALALAVAVWAFAGALFRLEARQRQRKRALAAAGPERSPLPGPLPGAHVRRGLRPAVPGAVLCLAAALLLVSGLAADLAGARAGTPYDALAHQITAMVLLIAGTPLLGRGITARLAARRLHREPQPALLVGVRRSPHGHDWLYPDASTVDAPPLIGYDAWVRNIRAGTRLLVSGAGPVLRTEHHDVDAGAEPFEAVLYGIPSEGAEVVLAYAVYATDWRIAEDVAAAPLLPGRSHGFSGPWRPLGRSHRLEVRRREAEREERRREEARQAAERRLRERERARKRESDGRRSDAGGCGGGSSCGGSGCGGCGCG
ncbi:hypothetical protein [Streptomyces sp. NPDC012888]|uniref:hypothetical protein n=1 Tax=Streptomyces sp. NPDC012888 TaxID=3364855 RepID=UPI0036D16920